MDRLLQKHKEAARFVPPAEILKKPGATVGIISLGGCDPAVREAVDLLAKNGHPLDYMRLKAFPFGEEVEKFIADHEFCFVMEQNRDAQLRTLLLLETPTQKDQLRSILIYGGFPLSARSVIEAVEKQLTGDSPSEGATGTPRPGGPKAGKTSQKVKELDAVNR
jgi:2-oxoglutarate ferredoxin oxidoreductase subunit alpha